MEPRESSSSGASGDTVGITMGRIPLICWSRSLASSSWSLTFSASSRLRSRARSDRLVSKRISTSPFFTVSPSRTRISVTVWVSERNTV